MKQTAAFSQSFRPAHAEAGPREIFDSLERNARCALFTIPMKTTEHFLNQHLRLIAEEPIDCRDLFDGDDEKRKDISLSGTEFL